VTLTVPDLKVAIGLQEVVLGLTKRYECNDGARFGCRGFGIGAKIRGEREEARGA
jgi:hypothetical protein